MKKRFLSNQLKLISFSNTILKMNRQYLKQLNLPDKPGVYLFRQRKEVLYVGKATSLKDRVRSYFNPDLEATRGLALVQMRELADNLSFIETDSVLEALILEAELIKKYRPKYNIKEKDDKSFNFVVITKETFPRVLLIRGRELEKQFGLNLPLPKGGSAGPYLDEVFGPFPKGGELTEALKIIRKIFPYRDKCVPNSSKPCFNAQIGLCPGVCRGTISAKDYAVIINNIKRLFAGKKKDILRDLEKQMKFLASKQEFEKAGELKRKIFTLNHIQDISLIKFRQQRETSLFRIESYDIAHLAGQNTVGVMAVILDGEIDKSAYRKFTIRGLKSADTGQTKKVQINDLENLKEILVRRFSHDEWPLPGLIVLDGGKAQLKIGQNILNNLSLNIPVVSVVKDEYHRPREILGDKKIINEYEREIILANSEAHRFAIHFHRQIRRRVV